jgi:hypothetical protein
MCSQKGQGTSIWLSEYAFAFFYEARVTASTILLYDLHFLSMSQKHTPKDANGCALKTADRNEYVLSKAPRPSQMSVSESGLGILKIPSYIVMHRCVRVRDSACYARLVNKDVHHHPLVSMLGPS